MNGDRRIFNCSCSLPIAVVVCLLLININGYLAFNVGIILALAMTVWEINEPQN